MVSVGQKIKMPNTCEKQFCKKIRVVLRKKPVGKTANIREMAKFWKSASLQRIYSQCKGYRLCKNGQFGPKIKKGQKHAKNYSTRTLELFCAKNRSKKHQIFEKWDDFENQPCCKGYSPCLGFLQNGQCGSKMKMLNTCEKRFCKNIRVVLRKKPLGKTANIRKIIKFCKSASLQRL